MQPTWCAAPVEPRCEWRANRFVVGRFWLKLGDTLTASGGFRGIMAYSLREALWLVGLGARDILMGYPTADRGAIADLAADDTALASITLMVDDDAQLDLIRSASTGMRLSACVSTSTRHCGSARSIWAYDARRCANLPRSPHSRRVRANADSPSSE